MLNAIHLMAIFTCVKSRASIWNECVPVKKVLLQTFISKYVKTDKSINCFILIVGDVIEQMRLTLDTLAKFGITLISREK